MDAFSITGTPQMKAKILQVALAAPQRLEQALYRQANAIMNRAKEEFVPVKWGTLKRSGRVHPPEWHGGAISVEMTFGDAASPYALCVFDGDTNVATADGLKRIAEVAVGDRVLAQTGEFRSVLAVTRTPAMLKPTMVDLVARWRRGRDHRLTVTADHRVLVFRGGRRLWVAAGDVAPGDALFHRRKQAHNKGHRAYTYVCSHCCQTYGSWQGRKSRQLHNYCSMTCRNAAYRTDQHPSTGKPRTPESLRPAAVGRARRRWSGVGTEEERAVERWLIRRGVTYLKEHKIGRKVVDFYLPDTNVAIEADGAFWHQDQASDIARDRELLLARPDLTVIHLHFFNEQFSPAPLDERPLPGVYYVACNPGPETFVDPLTFDPSEVIDVRPWTYRGGSQKLLYDLTVDGIHSFVAGGLIISNSVHEHLSIHSPYSWRIAEETGHGVHFHPHGHGVKYLEIPINEAAGTLLADLAAELKL